MDRVDNILKDVKKELKRATRIHGEFNSIHEAYAVILEELEEFWDEVRKRKEQRSRNAIREELIQIAAASCKAILSLKI